MWSIPANPENEHARLRALAACDIMDTPREERFDRITWLAQRYYGADVAFLGFIDAGHQWMKSVTSSSIGQSIERRRSVCQIMISTGEPLVVPDLRTDPRFAGHPVVPQLSLRFYAGVPLLVAPDLAIGSLCVMRHDPGEPADSKGFDIRPLEALASIAIDELELRKVNRELEKLSRADALTGLANRRGFDEELVRAGLRCQRTGEALSVLLLDIDHFKVLNDTEGHAAGDEALKRVAEALQGARVREDDTIARHGGEEFSVILIGSDAEGAHLVAERIREAVQAAAIAHPKTGMLTLSIGVASRPPHDLDIRSLVAEADAALYAAKRGGRNRVVSHSAEIGASAVP